MDLIFLMFLTLHEELLIQTRQDYGTNVEDMLRLSEYLRATRSCPQTWEGRQETGHCAAASSAGSLLSWTLRALLWSPD